MNDPDRSHLTGRERRPTSRTYAVADDKATPARTRPPTEIVPYDTYAECPGYCLSKVINDGQVVGIEPPSADQIAAFIVPADLWAAVSRLLHVARSANHAADHPVT